MSFAGCLISPNNAAQWHGLLARFGEKSFRAAVDAESRIATPVRIDRIRHLLGCPIITPVKTYSSTELEPEPKPSYGQMQWNRSQAVV